MGPRVPKGRKLAKSSEKRWQRKAPEPRRSGQESAGGMFTKNEKTRRWTEQSSEGVVEPWEVSAGGDDRSSEDPNKSWEVEQLGRVERNGQTELRTTHQRCSEPKPSQDREFREEFAERARGVATENSGAADREPEVSRRKLRRLDGTVGDVGRRDDRSPEDADKMLGGGTVRKHGPNGRTELRSDAARNAVTTYRIWRAQSDNTTCKLQQHPRDVRNQKDRDRGSEGNFAKSCEENRRRAPKIAGGASQGLEGSTERDSRLKQSLGDAGPKGDRNPEEPEEGREVLINSRERPNEIPDSTEPRSRTAKW
ncbi:hypothetical protein DFH06DRAFT_1129369 [Mycena polygramma]|nr:hypothetical protein DFH06DRAFT_1129369 [Mycena polygramma]